MKADKNDMCTLIVRRMREEDIPAVAAIESETFSEPWTQNGFRDMLKQKDACYLTAELPGEDGDAQIVGYCGYLRSFEEADIMNVAVSEAHRNTGIGRQMLSELIRTGRADGISRFTLEVRAGNHAAIHLYETLGFQTAGYRKNFYRLPTEDAAIMWTQPYGTDSLTEGSIQAENG